MVFLLCLSSVAQVALSGKDLKGNKDSLDRYQGKIVVLNFWATWCVPCKEEMKLLTAAQRDYGDRGITVIAASLDVAKDRKYVDKFVQKQKMTMPVWVEITAEEMEKVTNSPAVPATLFIDRNGNLIGRVLGQLRSNEIKERLDWMLSDRTGSAPAAEVNHLK